MCSIGVVAGAERQKDFMGHTLGNIRTGTIQAAWKGEEMRHFREGASIGCCRCAFDAAES
jgi:hypothetical protein